MDFINEKIKTHQVTQNKNTNGNHDDPEDDLLEQLAILKAMFQKQNKMSIAMTVQTNFRDYKKFEIYALEEKCK